ncbi:hypothetical protein EON67_03230 [archaeon]|nr:MAG: hypothetical protein EON67_03230 [archaeon]
MRQVLAAAAAAPQQQHAGAASDGGGEQSGLGRGYSVSAKATDYTSHGRWLGGTTPCKHALVRISRAPAQVCLLFPCAMQAELI